MYFLYNNLADSASSVTGSSEATNFPDDNVIHPFRTKVWTTDGGTPGTATLTFDLGSATSITSVALIDYTWTEQPGTLQMEWDDDSGFGSIDATETLTWAANPTTNGNRGTIIKVFSSHSYRYVRLNVVYSPGATPTDWSLGRIFLGTYFQPTQKRLANGTTETFIDNSFNSFTAGGQRHSDQVTTFRTKTVGFMIEGDAQRRLFQTIYNNNNTTVDMFVTFDYTNDPDEETYYCTFDSLPAISRVPSTSALNDYFNVQMSLKESV